MASDLQLVAITDTGTPDPAWLADVADLLDRLEARWSRFLSNSDVSRLNVAGGRPVAVDPSTITLLDTMIDAWRRTDRRFDPTTLPALIAAGYRASIDDPRRITLLPDGGIDIEGLDHGDARLDAPTLDAVEIDRDAGTIRLPIGLTVDAGGIGKGLAADLAVARAVRAGADGAMASIGGDIAMAGRPPEGGWNIRLEHPHRAPELVGTIAVTGGGVATSSTMSRRWQHHSVERHHVIDPWTGTPSTTDLASVTVVARSGWLAEAHATAAILAGSDHAVDHLDRHELSGLAVTADGRVLTTDDLSTLRSDLVTISPGGSL
jgi:thiamine biosynthesis lipoprotein